MIHPSMQPGFHPTAGTWIFLVLMVIIIFAPWGRRRGS